MLNILSNKESVKKILITRILNPFKFDYYTYLKQGNYYPKTLRERFNLNYARLHGPGAGQGLGSRYQTGHGQGVGWARGGIKHGIT